MVRTYSHPDTHYTAQPMTNDTHTVSRKLLGKKYLHTHFLGFLRKSEAISVVPKITTISQQDVFSVVPCMWMFLISVFHLYSTDPFLMYSNPAWAPIYPIKSVNLHVPHLYLSYFIQAINRVKWSAQGWQACVYRTGVLTTKLRSSV